MICKKCNGDMGPEHNRYGCASCNLANDDTAAARACKAFGSAANLAKAIGVARSTVTQWRRRGGFIPSRLQPKIIEVASQRGIDLPAIDLLHS